MKIEVLQENLKKAVSFVSRMVSSKAQLPVLNNILIGIEDGELKLSATNLETGINWRLKAKVEGEGKITVPARIFYELVSSLPKGSVYIETEKDRLKIKCEGYKSIINGIAAEEFPEVPSLRDDGLKAKKMKVNKELLESSIEKVALAAGVDEARPVFTGIKLEIGKNGTRMAATDGYRLSVKNIKEMNGKEKTSMIVPAKALEELVRLLDSIDAGEDVVIASTDEEKQLILAFGEVEIVTRLIEGDFPDYEKIIPKNSNTKILLNVEELEQAVRAASIFARDSANIVKFKIEKSGLTVSANAPQVGENEIKLDGKVQGDEAEIAFNSRYLLDLLSKIGSENVRLEMSGALKPGVFNIEKDDDFLHIIMPVRVQK